MKILIVLLSGICLLSTTVNAQSADKKQVKIEKKEVVLLKKTPVQLQRVQRTQSKKSAVKPILKEEPKKRIDTPTEPEK